MHKLRWSMALLTLASACGDDDKPRASSDAGAIVQNADAMVLDAAAPAPAVPEAASSSADAAGTDALVGNHSGLTYWQDMVPIFETHCMQCHQQGGIGPFRMDDFAEVQKRALLIARSTGQRTMPPWDVTSDGTCGDFQHSLALSEPQIQRIAAWVDGGALEGTKASVRVPAPDALASAKDYATPSYVPVVQGGALAEADDYHCFPLDANVDATKFITGYEVVPGNAEVVHHVVVSLVDLDAPAEAPAPAGTTNRQVMEELDKQSPEVVGWPCFGLAGDGVAVTSVPVVWAPGQGVVRYPGESGVPLKPNQKVVVQVHYNLVDAAQRGKSDASKVRLQLADKVENIGVFALVDSLLDSLYKPQPDVLEPGKASVLYNWKRDMKELGLEGLPTVKLWGVMPHMHQRGHKYQLRLKTSASAPLQCAADVKRWDFHWQRLYFYQKPWELSADSELEGTCDFDTSDATSPVLPGWGTRNEMCLATLYMTVPASAVGL